MSNQAAPHEPIPAIPAADAPPTPTSGVDEHIGARVRMRRRVLGLTQEDLAVRVGVTPQQIHKYESGANRVAASKLFEIATALSLPISTFFDGLPAPSEESQDAEVRAKNRLLLDKDILELAMSFDDIEEARLRRVVLRIIRAATEEAHKKSD